MTKIGFSSALALRPLRYLGERSYGIYLWHWPIMVGFGVAKEPLSPSWRRLVAIGLTLIVAEVSYRAVEQPIRQRGLAAFGSRWRPPLGATVATVIALAAVFAPTADAVSSAAVTLPLVPVTTTPASTASSTSTSADVVTSVPGATGPPSATTLRPTTVPPTPPTTIDTAVLASIAPPAGRAARVLYVGDSVGWFLAIGGDDDAKRLGIQVTNGAEPECVLTHQPISLAADGVATWAPGPAGN